MSIQIDHPHQQSFGGADQPVDSVSVIVPAGSIDVVTHSDPHWAHLDVHEVAGAPISVTFEGGALKVEQFKDADGQVWGALKGFLGGTFGAAFGASAANLLGRITLTVPSSAKVSVKTVTADILVGGVEGGVGVHTVSGTITLDRLAGNADVNTVSGDAEAASCTGELKVKTVAGRVTVQDSALRSCKLNSVSGSAAIDLSTGPSLVTANAVSGDLTIRMPAHTGYDATVASTSGHVVVDGHSLRSDDGKRGGRSHEGDRSVAIKARTVSGNVVVLRTGDDEPTGAGPVVGEPHPGMQDVQDTPPSPQDSRTEEDI